MISKPTHEKLKNLKILTHLCLRNNQNWKLFFAICSLQNDPVPETRSRSEIPDFDLSSVPDPNLFDLKNPDPKLINVWFRILPFFTPNLEILCKKGIISNQIHLNFINNTWKT